MADVTGKKLSFELNREQLAALQPLIDATGRIRITGTIEGTRLTVSYIACNAAFMACNAAFVACNASFVVGSAKTPEAEK